MQDEIVIEPQKTPRAVRYRFHPLVRFFMIALGLITAGYSIYFITILIPHTANYTIFFKIISVVVLYIACNTTYNHLTGLNSVIIYEDRLELRFLLRRTISLTWDNLIGMEIYKVITHYWKLTYIDKKGNKRIFKTSLAFPGIINILLTIQDIKPDIELNDLLRQVLLFKRKTTTPPPQDTV